MPALEISNRATMSFQHSGIRLSTITPLLADRRSKALGNVLIRSVVKLRKVIQRATGYVTDYMINSYPPEAQSATGVVRAQMCCTDLYRPAAAATATRSAILSV